MTPKRGEGWLWPFGDHFFGAEGAEKWEFLKIFGQNYVQWPIFGAAGAENFVKFRYFSEKSPNFVKVEDFIAQLCIKWRKKSRKPLYIGYFFEFCSVTTFSENPPVRWPKPRSPPPSLRSLNRSYGRNCRINILITRGELGSMSLNQCLLICYGTWSERETNH